MISLQRASASGGTVASVPKSVLAYDTTFVSSGSDVWINGLWLVSLALTLSTAVIAGLVKQWLHYYMAEITDTTPKARALTRQFRYKGLLRWNVPGIIESLPILMNTSLFLFFTGLILFVQKLSRTVSITWFLAGVTAILFVVYFGTSFLPIWDPQCPYKSSLSKVYFNLFDVCGKISKKYLV